MANNNELTYSVKFQHNPNDIKNIVDDVQKKLRNITIDIKGGKVDLSALTTQINAVEKNIKALDKLDFNGLKDSFSGLTSQLEKFSAEIRSLNTNFGANLGNAIVDALSKADKQIENTISKLNELAKAQQEAAGSGKKGTPQGVNNAVNLDLAKARIAEIDGLLTNVWKQLNASFKLKFDTGSLDDYSMRLQKLQQELRAVVAAGGDGKRVDDILRGANYSALKKDTTNEVKAVNDVSVAIEKLKASLESLSGIKGVGVLRKQINDLLRSLQGNGGNKLVQSEHVNRWLNELVNRANEAAKVNARIQKDATKASQQAAKEAEADRQRSYKNLYDNAKDATNAQKQIQEAVRKTREEFNKLYDRRTNLMNLQFLNPKIDLSSQLAAAQTRLTGMADMIRKMNIVLNQKGSPERFTQFLATNDINAYKNGLTAFYKEIQEAENKAFGSMKAQEHLDNVKKKIYDIISLMQKTGAAGLPLGDLQRALQELTSIADKLREIQQTGKTGGLGIKEWLKTGELSRGLLQTKDATSRAKQELDVVAKRNMASADAEIRRLKAAMNQINAIQAKSPELKINGVDRAIEDIKRLIRLLEQAKAQGSDIGRIQGIMGSYSSQNTSGTLARLSQDQEAAARTANQVAESQRRMEQAIASATGKAQHQSQVLGDLRSMAAQYLSVWGATSFIKEIANITGELELQQKSLEVIIGSAGQAQELFNNIKGLSQMSPYTFQDMLKSTRQLAAFGVETKDLYSTMKSLSDLGAGLNVDVQRLILAYGHVKSAGVLSGIQRRQFETAGINITGEIAKLYNERYKRAGSDERVTSADIFKRITKREIGFEDVEQAINRLTGPGGRFYEMQLKQYDTLGGKLRNLKNNYNIMLDEIGKSYMGLLTGTVDAFNSMMENWRTWGKLIKSVTLALVAAKAANIAFGKSWSAHRASNLSQYGSTLEARQIAAVNAGTSGKYFPRIGSVSNQQLAMPYANVIKNSDMTRYQKISAALYRNVSKDAANAILKEQNLNEVYRNRIARMNDLANSTKRLEKIRGRMQLGIERLSWSARGFFNTMRAGLASLVSNPMTWIAAAVAGFTALATKASEINEMRENTVKNVTESTREDIKEIDKALSEIKDQYFAKSESGETIFDINATSGNIESLFNELDQALQKFDPLYKGHVIDYKMIEDDKERVIAMFDDLENAKAGKQALKESISSIMTGNSESGLEGTTWYRPETYKWDTAIDEAKEYQYELTKVRGEVMAHVEEIENAFIEAQRRGWGDSAERAANEVSEMMKKYDMSFEEALQQYIDNGNELVLKTKNFKIDTSDMQEKLDSFSEKAQGMVKAMNAKMKSMFRRNASTGELASYLLESINAIFSVEGKEVTDPAAVANLQRKILEKFTPPEGASATVAERWKESIGAALDKVNTALAQAKLDEVINLSLDMGLINGDSSASEIISTIEPQMKAYFDAVVSKINDPAQKARVQAAFDKFWTGFTHNPKPAIQKFDQAWKRVWNKINDPNDPRFKLRKTFNVIFNASTDSKGFWEDLTKEVNRLKEEAQKGIKSFTVLQRVGINLDLVYNTSTAKAMLKQLAKEMLKIKDSGNTDLFMQMYNEAFLPMKKFVDGIENSEKLGRSVTGDAYEKAQKQNEKNARAAEKRQRERDRAKEKAKQAEEKRKRDEENAAKEAERKEIERIRNRIQQLQDLRREYKDLRQYNSKEAAMRLIQERYRHDYGEDGVLSGAEISAIEDYSKILDKEVEAIKANKKILNEEQRKRLIEAARRAQSELTNVIFKEKSDEMLSTLNSDLQKLLKQYEQAKKVIDATGDLNAASSISGMSKFDLSSGWLDNILEKTLDTRFAALLQSYDIDASKYSIDFGKVIGLDDKGIEEYVKDLIGDEYTGALVQAISAWLKEYKNQYDRVGSAAVDAYNKAAAAAMDYESQLMRINAELKEQNDLIDRSNATPEQKQMAKARNNANAEMKRLEATTGYKQYFDGIFTETYEEMEKMQKRIASALYEQLRTGAISASDYAKKLKEVNDKMAEFVEKDPSAWWNRGFFDDRSMEDRAKDLRDRGNALIEKGMAEGNQEMVQRGLDMVNAANNMSLAGKVIIKVIGKIDQSIQGIVSVFDYLSESLDALGVESDTMASMGDYIHAIGDMSGHMKSSVESFMRGDLIGGGVSAVGAITSLITGFARAHDNRLQRKIEDIQRDTTKMSNTLDTIRALRERSMGYDTGALRRQIGAAYNNGDTSKAAETMREYYSRYSLGSGYEQELQLLTEQREKIMEMYNLEASKKKKNKDELEDYRKQIADLDEQLMFFTEDLANELWGIDLKGWADQLGDALMTAFENGTSAASAFKDTVQDIMRGVVKNMLTVGIIEPALEKLRVKLFGTNGEGDLFNSKDLKGSMGAVLEGLGEWFSTEGPALMDAANEFYNGADDMMRQTLGYGMRESERSSNATTNSIQSTASEETMGVVAGYLSRLSQDVSVQRIMQEMFVNGSWPDYIEQVTSANNSLSAIDRSTTAMMEMMRDGNGALYERVENMSRRLDNFANGIDTIRVR